MKKRSELVFRLIHIPADYVMLVTGFVMAYLLREGQAKPFAYLVSTKEFLYALLLIMPLWIVIFAILGLYSISVSRSKLQEFSRVISATTIGTMLLIILDFFLTTPIFPSKAVPIYGFIIATVLVLFARYILYLMQRFLFRFGFGTHNTLILGEGAARIELENILVKDSRAYNIVENKTTNTTTLVKELTSINSRHALDDIFYIDNGKEPGIVTKVLNFCRQNQIQLHVLPTVMELYGAQMRSARLKNLALLEVVATPLDGWGRVLKRLIDIILSFLGLCIALPLMIIVGLIVLVTDPGPIFYFHERLTRSGKTIRVCKFRTMKQAYCTGGKYGHKSDIEILKSFGDEKLVAEWKRDQKVKNDPRVSRVGKFLRATSLDELPQLWNVFIGQLSFVGPRPIVESELVRYGDESGIFLHIKPGLTGLWQVSGRNDIDYDQRVKLDIYYIENWSLSLDIAILLRTIPVVLFNKSGY